MTISNERADALELAMQNVERLRREAAQETAQNNAKKRAASLEAERETLRTMFRSRDDVREQIDSTIAAWKAAALDQLRSETLGFASDASAPFPLEGGMPFGPALVLLHGEATVRRLLHTYIGEVTAAPNCQGRVERIAAIDAELASLSAATS